MFSSNLAFFQAEVNSGLNEMKNKRIKELELKLIDVARELQQDIDGVHPFSSNNAYEEGLLKDINKAYILTKALAKEGGNPNVRMFSGMTLLHLLVQLLGKHQQLDEQIMAVIQDGLQSKLFNLNERDDNNRTPIEMCIEKPYKLRAAVLLVELGAELKIYNSKHKSLVKLLVKKEEKQLLQELENYLKEHSESEQPVYWFLVENR